MDFDIFNAALNALLLILEPQRIIFLVGGVVFGLVLGIIPGIGGMVGMALLLPVTFTMDPYTAFAIILGMLAVVNTSDTIPAVLFGVPGTSAAQATIMDGYPMAKRGEAGRALSAAFTASLVGGLVGALALGLLIPFLRPLMLFVSTPELLAFSLFGLSMVAVLSGSSPLIGLGVAGFGLMISMIGADSQTGTMRWTMGQLYLWDGLPIIPVVMGLFAMPEIIELAIKRSTIAKKAIYNVRSGMLQGMKDVLNNKGLVLRTGFFGAGIGAIPGLGSSVIDWLAYGHALQTVKGARETFGTGDVRGVIGVESANNSNTAGGLVPTLAFGIPGSAAFAIVLAALLIQGLYPGPAMLSDHLELTYSMVWSITLANIFGTVLCLLFSGYLARLALVKYSIIFPVIAAICVLAAYQSTRSWGDIIVLVVFTGIGWTLKWAKWPRPPLILGFVLGPLVERYLFISMNIYDWAWVTRPIVLILLVVSLLGFAPRLVKELMGYANRKREENSSPQRFRPRPSDAIYVLMIVTLACMVYFSWEWRFGARIVPMIVGLFTLGVLAVSFVYRFVSPAPGPKAAAAGSNNGALHMDLAADLGTMTLREVAMRSGVVVLWMAAFIAMIALIGLIPAAVLFVAGFMRWDGKNSWLETIGVAGGLGLFMYIAFDRLLSLPWMQSYLGSIFPILKVIPSM